MAENFENKATRGSISQIILTALSSGSKYGYEICKDIEKLTGGKLILKQPSLYSSLRRMEEQDLISSYWEDSSLGGKRHYYSLTPKGKEVYEKNKDLWKNQEELLNNLPENTEIKNLESDLNEKENNSFEEQDVPSSKTFVLNQENLFNIAKTNDSPKMIKDEETLEEESDKNKSFLQFDFFEQNIKLVKESSENKNQELSVFTNKFSNMDNNSAEIEPDEALENQETLKFNELKAEETNETKTEPERSSYSILASSLLGLNEIKREDVFTNENIIKKEEINITVTESFSSAENEIKEKEEDTSLTTNLNSFDENINAKDNLKSTMNIDATNEDLESISWENSNNTDANKPVFESKDYRGLIGKLYNNSQLKDPYEQNKYHTFKEIFPSSQLKEKQKNDEIYKESAIDAIVESNSNSNIDCDDIKMLNNLYNLQGINIKMHSDIENKKQNKVYTDKNKLNMVCAWIISIVMLFEVLGAFFIFKNNNLIVNGQTIIYFLGTAFVLSYCLISTFENVFDRFKLVIIKSNFRKTFITRLLIFILAIILIFALNLAFGMTSLTQVEFLSFWVVPSLLASNILLEVIVYNILYNTKMFNS